MSKRKLLITVLLIMFSVFIPTKNVSAKEVKYHLEYRDLDEFHKKIADDILYQIKTYEGKEGVVYIRDVTQAYDLEDLEVAIKALNETYFPYYGKINIDKFYYVKKENEPLKTYSLEFDAKETQNALKINEKDDKIVKKWYKDCMKKCMRKNKKMSKLKKSKAIAAYIAKRTKYKSKQKYVHVMFKTKRCNCRAASELYKNMCWMAGIKSCRIVSGHYKKQSSHHAWTTFSLNGKRYYTDVTFARHRNGKKYKSVRKLPETHFQD